jgi:hypothetical protein
MSKINANMNARDAPRKRAYKKNSNKAICQMGINPLLGKSFWEYIQTVSVSSTTQTLFLMDPLLSSTGLMATYPQHANGYYNGSNFRLRQRITVFRVEMRVWSIGAQSNALASGDLFNNLRFSFYMAGAQYTDSTEQYLGNGVFGGSDVDDISQVYLDHNSTLSSTAFVTTTGYNVPATRFNCWTIRPKAGFTLYSSSTSGASIWNTERGVLRADVVSDSSVVPHPEFRIQAKFFFEYN